MVASQFDQMYREVCRTLYPNQYWQSGPIRFVGVPNVLSKRTHSMRDFVDLGVPIETVKNILGYNQSEEKDKALDAWIFSKIMAQGPSNSNDDKHVMMITCYRAGEFLEEASERLRDDQELVIVACRDAEVALRFASARLRDDREFVLELCRRAGIAFKWVSPRLQDDEEIAQVAFEEDCAAIHYASARLQQNREVDLIESRYEHFMWEWTFDRERNWK